MSTSGTYAFQPATGEMVMQAFARIGVSRPTITAEHVLNARFEANLMFADWSNSGPNLWTVGLVSVALVQGQSTYALDASTTDILDAYLNDTSTDRTVVAISRSEYASYPTKAQQGVPTVYWFNRLTAPTVTLWPVPDSGGPYTLNYYRSRQQQDAGLLAGQTADLPYRWYDAMVWSLAARLAYAYAPDRIGAMESRAQQAYQRAADEDTEDAPMTFTPGLSSYFR